LENEIRIEEKETFTQYKHKSETKIKQQSDEIQALTKINALMNTQQTRARIN